MSIRIGSFWDAVNKTESCWLWLRYKNDNGYGVFSDNGKLILAHRYSYELLVGPVPDGKELHHKCETPGCVNPEHLEPLTHQENVLLGHGPSAQNARKTECKAGHPYTKFGYIYEWNGKKMRRCSECMRLKNKSGRRSGGRLYGRQSF